MGTPGRIFQVEALLRRGLTVEQVHEATRIDPWFLDQMLAITEERWALEATTPDDLGRAGWRRAKRLGFSDAQLAHLWGIDPEEARSRREAAGVRPTYKTVDTCGAEFAAETPYHYSAWEDEDEVRPSDRPKVMILGSGPNRIGQGIEFDYCCVHAAFALKEEGLESLMINSNPETLSTDYDTSDKLFFEPLTLEDVLHIYEREKCWGAIAQFGGQTPLNLALDLQANGVNIIGTSPQSIERAEDREEEARIRASERGRPLLDEVLERDVVIVDLVDEGERRVGLGGGEHEGRAGGVLPPPELLHVLAGDALEDEAVLSKDGGVARLEASPFCSRTSTRGLHGWAVASAVRGAWRGSPATIGASPGRARRPPPLDL